MFTSGLFEREYCSRRRCEASTIHTSTGPHLRFNVALGVQKVIHDLQAYVHGVKAPHTNPEHWGILTIKRWGRGSLRATLKTDSTQDEVYQVLPPLWNVWISRCWQGIISIGGHQKIDKSWYMQLWHCRLVTAHENNVAAFKGGTL